MYKGVSNNSLIDFYFSNLRNIERAESTDHNSNSCVKVSGAGTMSESSTMSEPTPTLRVLPAARPQPAPVLRPLLLSPLPISRE